MFALGSDGSIWKYATDGNKKARRKRAEDLEIEEGSQEFTAEAAEAKMVV